jgi:hypothetical protein
MAGYLTEIYILCMPIILFSSPGEFYGGSVSFVLVSGGLNFISWVVVSFPQTKLSTYTCDTNKSLSGPRLQSPRGTLRPRRSAAPGRDEGRIQWDRCSGERRQFKVISPRVKWSLGNERIEWISSVADETWDQGSDLRQCLALAENEEAEGLVEFTSPNYHSFNSILRSRSTWNS